jgi:diaminohydroxyphosphoribosylaminopyrimidine deaminase / 5-amino-6-(5-phosphoribosylamino)uracil reductase
MDVAADTDCRAVLDGRAAPGPLFAPLFAPPRGADGCVVVGRLAQTLDGRIATASGSSQWIGGPADLRHTHRLRALCQAVVVGAGTVAADDPQLTTRLVEGPSPLRVVLDPAARLGTGYKVFQGGPPTLLVVGEGAAQGARHGEAEVMALPRGPGGLDLVALLHALAARGATRVFVEGGGVTVSRFLLAGLLDRLHVTVAPIILGSGRPAFALPEAPRIADGLRLPWTVHDIAPDILVDMAVDRARPALDGA